MHICPNGNVSQDTYVRRMAMESLKKGITNFIIIPAKIITENVYSAWVPQRS